MNFYDAIFEPAGSMHRPPTCPPKTPINFAGMGYSQRGVGECAGISLPQLQFTAPSPSRAQYIDPYGHAPSKRQGYVSHVGNFAPRFSLSEELIRTHTIEILSQAQHSTLKSVELANALRDRIAVEHFNEIKKSHGGLLSLLQRFPGVFRVDRIPKNDRVTLLIAPNPTASQLTPRINRQDQASRSLVLPIAKPSPASPSTSNGACSVFPFCGFK